MDPTNPFASNGASNPPDLAPLPGLPPMPAAPQQQHGQVQQQQSPVMQPNNPFFSVQPQSNANGNVNLMNNGQLHQNNPFNPMNPMNQQRAHSQSVSAVNPQQQYYMQQRQQYSAMQQYGQQQPYPNQYGQQWPQYQQQQSQFNQPHMLKRESAPTFQQHQMQPFANSPQSQPQMPPQQPQFNKSQSNNFYPAANNPFQPLGFHQKQSSAQSNGSNNGIDPSNPFFSPSQQVQPPLHEQQPAHVVPPPPAEPHPDLQKPKVSPVQRQVSRESKEIQEEAFKQLEASLPEKEPLSPEQIAAEKEEKRKRNRVRAVDELISTEVTYIKKLKMLNTLYKDPMQKDTKLLKPMNHSVLFPIALSSIWAMNKTLCSTMKKNKDQIGKALHDFIPFMKMYKNYNTAHGAATALIRRLREDKNSEFSKYLAAKELEQNGFTLESYLILPIQRLPRYELCLKEIIKLTKDDHPDKKDLQVAYEKIAEVNKHINIGMKDYDTRQKVREIDERIIDSNYHSHDKVKPQRTKTTFNIFNKKSADKAPVIGGPIQQKQETLVQPWRSFVKEGYLTKVSQKKDIKYFFILFSDLLIYCSERPNDKLQLHRRINITDEFFRIESAVILDDGDEKEDESKKKKKNKRANTFEIHSIEKSFLCYADNAEQREEWIEAIEKCVHQCRKNKQGRGRGRSSSAAISVSSPSMSGGVRNTSAAFRATLSAGANGSNGPPRNEVDEGRILETAPIWIPNDWTDECMMPECNSKFNAFLMKTRNHCRYCGKLICTECATHTLPHYEPSRRKAKVHVKVCDLCYEKYKAKPLMNMEQLNELGKQISEDSRASRNTSVQIDDDWQGDSDSDDWNVDSMYSVAPGSNPGSAPGSARTTTSNLNTPASSVSGIPFFGSANSSPPRNGNNFNFESNNTFEKPLPQSKTSQVGGGDDLHSLFNNNGNPGMQRAQSQPRQNPHHNNPMVHAQSMMQINGSPANKLQSPANPNHGPSLSGFIRNINASNLNAASSASGSVLDDANHDIFGDLPDEPLPGTPSADRPNDAAVGYIDQMMSANNHNNNQLAVNQSKHAQSDSYANAVVLGDDVEVEEQSDSDSFAANFQNIVLPGSGNPDPNVPRQSTNEVLYPFMGSDGNLNGDQGQGNIERLDVNHEKVKELNMFGFSTQLVEAAWILMKKDKKDHSIVPDHGPVFTEKMMDYLDMAQKEQSKQSIMGAYNQNNGHW